jgi:hypothetical protein
LMTSLLEATEERKVKLPPKLIWSTFLG